MRSDEDFEHLHSNIVLLLDELCRTKAEYKDVIKYRDDLVIVTVRVDRGSNGEIVELEGKRHEHIIKLREKFVVRLDEILAQLEKKYVLKAKLQKPQVGSLKSELQDIRNQLQYVKAELSGLRADIADKLKE